MNRLLIGLILLVGLVSCSKKMFVSSGSTKKLNNTNVDYQYLSLKSKVKYQGQNQSIRFTANIRIKKDSLIWFSLSPGFGIEAARGLVTRDSLFIHNKIEKSFQRLSLDNFSKQYQFDFDLHLLESILIGNLFSPIQKKDKVVKKNDFYKITKKQNKVSVENYIGLETMKLEKVDVISELSSSTLSIQYDEFQQKMDAVYPSAIQVLIKTLEEQTLANIEIQHSKLTIDNAAIKFNFHIPPNHGQK